jgi:hypothetical protein
MRVVVEDATGLVSINEAGATSEDLAMMFIQAMLASGFHVHAVLVGMETAIEEIAEAYDIDE